jgi:hypothetical protein
VHRWHAPAMTIPNKLLCPDDLDLQITTGHPAKLTFVLLKLIVDLLKEQTLIGNRINILPRFKRYNIIKTGRICDRCMQKTDPVNGSRIAQ